MTFDEQDPNDAPADSSSSGPGDPWSADELAQAQQWAQDWYSQHQIPASWGQVQDLVNNYQQQRQNGVGHQQAMDTVPGLLGWDKYTAPQTTPTPSPAPAPGPTGQSGPSGPLLTDPFTDTYTPYQQQPLPTVGGSLQSIPGAPDFPTIPRFTGPTIEEAMNDPGYKFVLDQGNKNLENWSAARGTLNDSSTAKALTDYGQAAAGTQYGSVWDRNYNAYQTNAQTQYIQPWEAKYQNWLTGTVNPTMAAYQTNSANVQHQNDLGFQDQWNQFLQKWNQFRDQRDSTFNKRFSLATA